MSVFRKRSSSQAFSFNGEEDFTVKQAAVTRKTLVNERQFGRSSPATSDIQESCASRHFPKQKSELRFLTWVAYTRKYSDDMTDEERKKCPLLWCRRDFEDQEEMLKHVYKCEHLSKGQYYCSSCGKAERVGKFPCQKTHGLSYRAATAAKKVFSKLGVKHHRSSFSVPRVEVNSWLSSIPEASGNVEDNPPARDFDIVGEQNGQWGLQATHELPDTNVIPGLEMNGDSWEVPIQDAPYSPIPEMENTFISEMSGSDSFVQHGESSGDISSAPVYTTQDMWNPSPYAPPEKEKPSPRAHPILPLLNTQPMYEPARENHQLDFQWSGVANFDTIISPLSPSDGIYPNMLSVSPTDTISSNDTFFTDSGYASATCQTQYSFENSEPAQQASDVRVERSQHVFAVLEPSNHYSLSDSEPASASNYQNNYSPFLPVGYGSEQSVEIPPRPQVESPRWSDAPGLVRCFAEVLDEHIQHSRSVLQKMHSNSITKELISLSSDSLKIIGLDVLTGIVEGRNPSGIVGIFALTHVAYAFSLVVLEDPSVLLDNLFEDSLSWLSGLASETQRRAYMRISRAIWKPREIDDIDRSKKVTSIDLWGVRKSNQLVTLCERFLDIFESFGSSSNSHHSSLSTIGVQEFSIKAKTLILDELSQMFPSEHLQEKIKGTESRLYRGLVSNLRGLELELICIGEICSEETHTRMAFQDQVRRLCDIFYTEGMSAKSRTTYHVQDISMIRYLIPDESSQSYDSDQEIDIYPEVDSHDTNPNNSKPPDDLVAAFAKYADEILNHDYFTTDFKLPSKQSKAKKIYTPQTTQLRSRSPKGKGRAQPLTSIPNPQPQLQNDYSPNFSTLDQISTIFPPSRNRYRCFCGYEPAGEERWKSSNLTRHKRTKHSREMKSYACNFPGCISTFTRSDNLRSHQRDKGHGDEEVMVRSMSLEDGYADEGFRDEGYATLRSPLAFAFTCCTSSSATTAEQEVEERGS
ncbi:hypothetical protein B7494_g7021 [Chlorociboria aeruginascens]|nr:hypothetical protein B7494_g7021 [Chlorociboria aeruginascens]